MAIRFTWTKHRLVNQQINLLLFCCLFMLLVHVAATNAAGNMRSEVVIPSGVEMFPHFLREAGYYCVNKSKEDYNYFKPANAPWDESSGTAHYRNRKDGQPFFVVFNYKGTHESKIRKRPHKQVIDPATVHLARSPESAPRLGSVP